MNNGKDHPNDYLLSTDQGDDSGYNPTRHAVAHTERHACPLCVKSFHCIEALRRHVLFNHGGRAFEPDAAKEGEERHECRCCLYNKSFEMIEKLKEHLEQKSCHTTEDSQTASSSPLEIEVQTFPHPSRCQVSFTKTYQEDHEATRYAQTRSEELPCFVCCFQDREEDELIQHFDQAHSNRVKSLSVPHIKHTEAEEKTLDTQGPEVENVLGRGADSAHDKHLSKQPTVEDDDSDDGAVGTQQHRPLPVPGPTLIDANSPRPFLKPALKRHLSFSSTLSPFPSTASVEFRAKKRVRFSSPIADEVEITPSPSSQPPSPLWFRDDSPSPPPWSPKPRPAPPTFKDITFYNSPTEGYTALLRRDGLQYSLSQGRDFRINGFKKLSTREIHDPVLRASRWAEDDQSIDYFYAQLLHRGLPLTRTKEVAKWRLYQDSQLPANIETGDRRMVPLKSVQLELQSAVRAVIPALMDGSKKADHCEPDWTGESETTVKDWMLEEPSKTIRPNEEYHVVLKCWLPLRRPLCILAEVDGHTTDEDEETKQILTPNMENDNEECTSPTAKLTPKQNKPKARTPRPATRKSPRLKASRPSSDVPSTNEPKPTQPNSPIPKPPILCTRCYASPCICTVCHRCDQPTYHPHVLCDCFCKLCSRPIAEWHGVERKSMPPGYYCRCEKNERVRAYFREFHGLPKEEEVFTTPLSHYEVVAEFMQEEKARRDREAAIEAENGVSEEAERGMSVIPGRNTDVVEIHSSPSPSPPPVDVSKKESELPIQPSRSVTPKKPLKWYDNIEISSSSPPPSPSSFPPGKYYWYRGQYQTEADMVPTEVPQHTSLMLIPPIDDYETIMVPACGDTRNLDAGRRQRGMLRRLDGIDSENEDDDCLGDDTDSEEERQRERRRKKRRGETRQKEEEEANKEVNPDDKALRGIGQLDGCDDSESDNHSESLSSSSVASKTTSESQGLSATRRKAHKRHGRSKGSRKRSKKSQSLTEQEVMQAEPTQEQALEHNGAEQKQKTQEDIQERMLDWAVKDAPDMCAPRNEDSGGPREMDLADICGTYELVPARCQEPSVRSELTMSHVEGELYGRFRIGSETHGLLKIAGVPKWSSTGGVRLDVMVEDNVAQGGSWITPEVDGSVTGAILFLGGPPGLVTLYHPMLGEEVRFGVKTVNEADDAAGLKESWDKICEVFSGNSCHGLRVVMGDVTWDDSMVDGLIDRLRRTE